MCRRSSSNEYYVEDRKFNVPEIHILMDAIRDRRQRIYFVLPVLRRVAFFLSVNLTVFSVIVKMRKFEADKSLIDVVFDFFGADLYISETSGDKIIFTAEVQVSKPFIAWCCSFGTGVKVTAPQTVVETVKNYLAETAEQYK